MVLNRTNPGAPNAPSFTAVSKSRPADSNRLPQKSENTQHDARSLGASMAIGRQEVINLKQIDEKVVVSAFDTSELPIKSRQ